MQAEAVALGGREACRVLGCSREQREAARRRRRSRSGGGASSGSAHTSGSSQPSALSVSKKRCGRAVPVKPTTRLPASRAAASSTGRMATRSSGMSGLLWKVAGSATLTEEEWGWGGVRRIGDGEGVMREEHHASLPSSGTGGCCTEAPSSASRAQARVAAAAAEFGAERSGLQAAAPRRGVSCASPMRFIAPRDDSRAPVASTYVRSKSGTPLVRRTLQNSDVLISLTLAATVVAMANEALSDLDGPLRQINRARQRRVDAPGREP